MRKKLIIIYKNLNIRTKKKQSKKVMTEIIYQSSEAFLNEASKEYDRETKRAETINNRAGIFVSAIAVLLTFYLPNLRIHDLLKLNFNSFQNFMPYFVLLILYIATVSLILIATLYFVRVLSTRKYLRLDSDDLSSEKHNKVPKDVACYSIAHQYSTLIKGNQDENDHKAKLYNKGVYFLSSSLLFMVISSILSQIIL